MTIGEKIVHLRTVYNISQEKLANKLNVTRQSVSKWESGESLPQVDKIKELCDLFDISADELIDDEVVIHRGENIKPSIGEDIVTKYFGTDGFRGEVNQVLTSDYAYKIGRFLGWYAANNGGIKHRPRVVIGKDTRRSSYMLEYAVAAGLTASGADVYLLHVTTTPSVSYVVRQDNFDYGVMITASHNPYYDNGIKVINARGEKLEDSVAFLVEAYIDHEFEKFGFEGDDLPLALRENVGTINDYTSGRNRYIGYLICLATHSFKELRIGLDTANGASWMIARNVFEALGANVMIMNNNPDGLNINVEAGSTHIEHLAKFVKDNHLDVGFAFDGDADRCLAVDENGKVVDGDKIMYLLACRLKRDDSLTGDTLVTTIMSNSGLTKALKQVGIKNVQTKVGDRFVFERMQRDDYALGGEQSGHVIIKKYATTGDGVLTALMVVEEMLDRKDKLSALVQPVKLLPQKQKSVKVTNKSATMHDEVVLNKYQELNEEIGDNGRILLRESGTEPVIRIMVELPTVQECEEYIEKMYTTIKKRGFVSE